MAGSAMIRTSTGTRRASRALWADTVSWYTSAADSMTTLGSIRSPSTARSSGFIRRSTTSGASSAPFGVTTNTSGRCFSACCSTSWPSRHGRDETRWTHGWSRFTPRARRPKKAAAPSAARAIRKMKAPATEPVAIHRMIQTSTTPAAICHRRRLRGGMEARAGRRIASPRWFINHRPRYRFAIYRAATGAPRPPITASGVEDAPRTRASQRIRVSFQTSGI